MTETSDVGNFILLAPVLQLDTLLSSLLCLFLFVAASMFNGSLTYETVLPDVQ